MDEREKLKYFGEMLKKARDEAEYTQGELGHLIDKNNDAIWNLEAGRRFPFKEEFDAFCDLFNKKPEHFFPDGVPELKNDIKKGKKDGSRKAKPRGMVYKPNPAIGKPAEGEDLEHPIDVQDELETMNAEAVESKTQDDAIKEAALDALDIPAQPEVQKIIVPTDSDDIVEIRIKSKQKVKSITISFD